MTDQLDNYLLERTDKAPIEYVEFKYRERMGYTPAELDEIPAHIVERDFYFMSREAWAKEWRER